MEDRDFRPIENLVRRFRHALDRAKDDGVLHEGRFLEFPRGCCDDACDLLARYLRENGVETECAYGTYWAENGIDRQSHAWLRLITNPDYIIDITGDQFKNFSDPLCFSCNVYCGSMNKFYRLFAVDKCYEAGKIESYNEPVRGVLFRTYDAVVNHLDIN